MGPRRASSEEDDDAGTLRDHSSRRSSGGEELRGQHRLGGQELGEGQIDRGRTVAVLGDAGPDRVELDVDSPGLPDDPVEVLVDSAVVKGVDHGVLGPSAGVGDLPGDGSERAPGPAREEDPGTLGAELPGDGGPDRAAGTEHNRTPLVEDG
jgi:hypothetical protein